MREKRVDADRRAAEVAARQHGVITTAQLYAVGLSAEGIRRRVRAGRLHRLFRGVYAVGHAGLSIEGRWMAAVLACGDGAALSHRSAAELWKLLDPARDEVHVSVPIAGGRSKREGIRIHRTPSLRRAATTRHDGIAVTTPSRTLVDLRASVPRDLFDRALRQAEFRRLALGIVAFDLDRTASELERRFLCLIRRHRLPEPEVNVPMAGFVVDFLWREQRLIAETDGYRYHSGTAAFESDRARDARLTALGYRVVRFTHRQLVREPRAVIATLRACLDV